MPGLSSRATDAGSAASQKPPDAPMLLHDATTLSKQSLDPDTVVIVGAGAVGIHLAVEIARRGRQVVVLEAGQEQLAGFSDKSFEVVGRPHDGIHIGRSVALGGTSNLWGGQLVEFMPADLDGREWLPGSRWPLRYTELAPYYPQTYDALGVDRDAQEDAAVWKSIGKTRPDLGSDAEVILTRWMKVPNVAAHFSKEVETNPQLLVTLGATVVGFEGEDSSIQAVKILDQQGNRSTVRGSDFVLCAGTIENSRLLLHAAGDPSWRCPWRDNDNIGRYFQDHLGGHLAYVKPRGKGKQFFDIFCTIVQHGQKFQPKLKLKNEVLEHEPVLANQGMVTFESSIRENMVFLKQFTKAALYRRKVGSLRELARSLFACWKHMIPLMWKYVVEHRVLIPSGSRISLVLQAEIEPLRESRIMIDPHTCDDSGLPKVLLDWRLSGRELGDILDFTQRIEKALQEANLADLQIEPKLAAADPDFLDQLHDTNHQAGGCIMGESAEDGVVDRNLRVFGTSNVYAAGPCVFRTSSNANVTFTAMTLGTRLAEHLTTGHHAAS